MSFLSKRPRDAASFRMFDDSMLQSEAYPLSEFISDELFPAAFERFDADFAADPNAVDTPAWVPWSWVSQALFKYENRSLTSAVTQIASW